MIIFFILSITFIFCQPNPSTFACLECNLNSSIYSRSLGTPQQNIFENHRKYNGYGLNLKFKNYLFIINSLNKNGLFNNSNNLEAMLLIDF